MLAEEMGSSTNRGRVIWVLASPESDSSGSNGVSNPDCGKRSHGTGICAACFSAQIGGIARCPERLGFLKAVFY
jgi:hypothetical protein